MLVRTGVHHNHRRVYRVVGRDLYSALVDRPLREQAFTVEKAGVLAENGREDGWHVVVRDGEVCLERVQT
jgi:hypothetical protein